MKILKKSQAIQRQNSENCAVTEYDMREPSMDFAIVKLNGRYPEKEFAVNLACKEMVLVQNGSGKVVVGEQEYPLAIGDLVLIEAGEFFYWEGNLELIITCRPAFSIDQHKIGLNNHQAILDTRYTA